MGKAVIGVMQSAYAPEALPIAVESGAARSEVAPVTAVVEGEEPATFSAPAPLIAVAPTDNPDEGGYVVAGNAAPGQHLLVLVQGIARVKVDASTTAILAGDTLVAAPAGQAVATPRTAHHTAASGLVVGRALESLDSGNGAIYVLLGIR